MTKTIEHLQAEVAELEEENARLIREVVNRNQRALDGDKAVKAADALYEQLATAEQRVSEAFIKCMVDLKQRDYAFTGTTVIGIEKCETAIRSGEWRKFST